MAKIIPETVVTFKEVDRKLIAGLPTMLTVTFEKIVDGIETGIKFLASLRENHYRRDSILKAMIKKSIMDERKDAEVLAKGNIAIARYNFSNILPA